MKVYLIFGLSLIFSSQLVFSHGGEKHDSKSPKAKAEKSNKFSLEFINNKYLSDVKPILKKKCFHCHGDNKDYPWYYVIPGPKHLINYHMEESKEHLDMREDFPFKGHGTPEKDLKAILKVVEEGSMPPITYRLMHWDKWLSTQEKTIIKKWANESLRLLEDLKVLK